MDSMIERRRDEDSCPFRVGPTGGFAGLSLPRLILRSHHDRIRAGDPRVVHDNVHFRRKTRFGSFSLYVRLEQKHYVEQRIPAREIGRRHFGEDSFHDFVTALKPLSLDLGVVQIVDGPPGCAGLERTRRCADLAHFLRL
jgi:hypothetical protein